VKFLFFLAIIIFGYLALKRYVSGLFSRSSQGGASNRPPITDELVKDPVCGVYVPKKEAIVYGRGGKLYYFCCEKCLKEFKKKHSAK